MLSLETELEPQDQPRTQAHGKRRSRWRNMGWAVSILLGVLGSAGLTQAQDDCSIGKVSHGQETASVVILTWETLGRCEDDKLVRFKVYPTHMQWMACPDGSNEPHHAQIIETEVHTARIEGLYPFSEYHFEIMGIRTSDGVLIATVNVTTASSVPEVQPQFSSASPVSYSQAVKFFWEPPTACKFFNGILGQYRVELWGVDPWVDNGEHLTVKNVDLPEYYAEGLQYFTAYKLNIFALNSDGEYNANLGLPMTARTESAKRPEAPVNLTITASSDSAIHLQWSPPYPPTTKITEYKLRFGINNSDGVTPIFWIRPVLVPVEHTCNYNQNRLEGHEPICWVLSDLEPDTVYFVEVQTFAHGTELPSLYSQTVMARTDIGPTSAALPLPARNDTQRAPRANTDEESSHSNLILYIFIPLIALALVIAVATVIVIFYRRKLRKLKSRFQANSGSVINDTGLHRGQHRFSSASTTYGPGMSSVTDMTTLSSRGGRSYVQQWTDQIQDIQSRRLPEPPPYPPRLPGLTNGSRAPSQAAPSIPERPSLNPSPFLEEEDEDDDPNMGDYLKPTFRADVDAHPPPFNPGLIASTPISQSSEQKIPPISYEPSTRQDVTKLGHPGLVSGLNPPDLVQSIGQDTSSLPRTGESFPLMTSKSVQV